MAKVQVLSALDGKITEKIDQINDFTFMKIVY